jgi:acetyl esterase/lipase
MAKSSARTDNDGQTLTRRQQEMSGENEERPVQDLRDVESPPEEALGRCRAVKRAVAGVGCHFLHPPEPETGRQLIYLHGGAFTSGPILHHWKMLATLCLETGIAAVMVHYRLAPQDPYPAGLNDALAVCLALGREKGRLNDLYLAGDSAGGGLCLSAALALKEKGEDLPGKLVLLSPWLDLTLSDPKIDTLEAADPLLEKGELLKAGRQYAGGHDTSHPLLSPIYGDFTGLPPVFLQVGTREIFVSDCRRFRRKAAEAGVRVVYQEWQEMFHDWMAFTPEMAEANRAVEQIASFLKEF